MENLVIIGAGEFQLPLIEKAIKMGYSTHVFSWKTGDLAESICDFFYPISIDKKEEIYEVCLRIKPVGFVTIASDLASITVQYLNEKFGFVGNSYDCMLKTTNKEAMRNALKDKGLITPWYKICNITDELELHEFPLIVKPTDRSGSRGINKVNNIDELKYAIKIATQLSFEKRAIIEEFIDGNEYSCEVISFMGRHEILAVTEKFTTGTPNFIETAHIQPASLNIKNYENDFFKALNALEITHGASHIEFKIDKTDKVRIIEVGARMAGDFIGSHLVPISTGHDYLKMVIQISCGIAPSLTTNTLNDNVLVKFILDENDEKVISEITKDSDLHVKHQVVKKGSIYQKVEDSSTRNGSIIVTSNDISKLRKLALGVL